MFSYSSSSNIHKCAEALSLDVEYERIPDVLGQDLKAWL